MTANNRARRPIVAGNWKMNTTLAEAEELASGLLTQLGHFAQAQVILCPPFISLPAVSKIVAGSGIAVGGQNIHWIERGAYTGEISTLMLRDLCQYVIVGHSERRQYFGETDETVGKKIAAAVDAGLTPIVCVGENLDQRESGQTEGWIGGQMEAAFENLSSETVEKLIIAYEPIWAIGTGRAATAEIAQDTIGFIRQTLASQNGEEIATRIPILYGGSATAANFGQYAGQPDIDGALVGGASLKVAEFVAIAHHYA